MAQDPEQSIFPMFNYEAPENIKILEFSSDRLVLKALVAQYVPTKSEWSVGYICNVKVSGTIWASHDLGNKRKSKSVRTDVSLCPIATPDKDYGKLWHFIEISPSL